MNCWPPRLLTAVPQSWPVRLEIAKAIQTLAAQLDEEKRLQRRAELAALYRESERLSEVVRDFCRELGKAEFNPDEPRVPAGNPEGGQWTSGEGNAASASSAAAISDANSDNAWIPGAQYAANDSPRAGEAPPFGSPPEVPPEKPATPQLLNAFLKAAAYSLAGALLASEPIGEFVLALEAAEWLHEFRPWIDAYLDPPKSLQELQRAAQNPKDGYNIHHVVEQTPAVQDGFPRSLIDGPDNLVLIPTFKHWQISTWFSKKNAVFDNKSPREYLRGKSWEERMRIGKDALVRFGVLVP